ncbi:MAG: hypothetical protein JXB39_11870, partial [Deltaproteobacteria bacterium]|nr:hypothetical protein [Deltaproteobacteria bacterium]
QVQFTGFQELDETGVLDALEDGTLGQSEVRIAFLCTPRASACAFSEFDVFGHDFRVSDAFGDGGGAWLLTRWGAGSAGVQGLEFLRPDPGSGTGSVRCGAPPSRVRLANVAVASESLRVVAGKDVVFDGSSLEVDARGWPLEPRRVDAATLLHLDASPDDVPSVLEDHGFEDAWAVRGDVGANGRVSLSALGRPAGIDLDGTWLLALWTSSSWVPAPVFLAVLVPEA